MDAEVFSDPLVKQHLNAYRLVRVDATNNDAAIQTILKQNNILGMPTLLIYNTQGHLVNRIAGFVDAGQLVKVLSD